MTQSAETAIVKFDGGAPLQHSVNLWNFRLSDPAWLHVHRTLNQAWPGSASPQERDHKTQQLVAQAVLAIDNSERPDMIRSCCLSSIFDTLIAAASMDLSVQKALGESYFLPFKGICTLMVGYRGFIKLLVNTGYVTSVESVLVYEGEPFDYNRDESGPHWFHKPDLRNQGHADRVIACYAVGYTRGGQPIFELMNAEELAKVRAASAGVKAGRPSPAYQFWATEMMRKAPIRRLQKYVPKTADNLGYQLLARAVEHDNHGFDLKGYAEQQKAFTDRKASEKALAWTQTAAKPAEPIIAKPQPMSSPDAAPPADWKPTEPVSDNEDS
jgi:recombination protein RecT